MALFPLSRSAATVPRETPRLAAQTQQPRDQYDPMGIGQQRRRGLFGGAAHWLKTRDWQALGAMMRDDPTFYASLIQQRGQEEDRSMRRDLFGMQRRQAEEQQAALDAAIGQLPEQQQPWARLAPEVVARSVLERPDTPDTHYDNNTGNFWQETPQGPRVVGRMPGWQRSGGDGNRAPPAGYRWTRDGGLEPIPGGPADQRVNETGRRRGSALTDSADNLQNVLGAIDEALPQITGETTGFLGQVFRGVGGTSAYNLREAIEPIVANLGFEALAEMRRNSETGGALGQVAVREIELLQRTVRSLDTAQSERQLRSNMMEVRRQVARTLQAVRAAQNEMAPQQGSDGVRVIELEPNAN